MVTILSIFDGGGSLLEDGGEGGQGSGFVVDGEGDIVTNAHVVTSASGVADGAADNVYVSSPTATGLPPTIVGDDPNADVALMKVDPAGLSLTPLRLGHSASIAVGEPVAAIGSPFGERQSLSVGVISALDRTIHSLTRFQIGDAIQTDAAINPGNSGGPLLDAQGRVIGINAQIKSQSGGGEGVGFAIPVDTVRRSLRELRDNGRVDYGYLGVRRSRYGRSWPNGSDSTWTTGALVQDVGRWQPGRGGRDPGGRRHDLLPGPDQHRRRRRPRSWPWTARR